jgi:RNA polymerase sigma factor (sigma-70 family)
VNNPRNKPKDSKSRDPASQTLIAPAFDDLQNDLLLFAWWYVRNESEAQELVSLAMTGLLQAVDRDYTLTQERGPDGERCYWISSPRHHNPVRLKLWLCRLIRNRGNDVFRKRDSRKKYEEQQKQVVNQVVDEWDTRDAKERLDWVTALIQETFPLDIRVILGLRWFYPWSYEDIAVVCGQSEETLRRWVCRAKKRLLDEIALRDPEFAESLGHRLPDDE